MPHRVTNFLRQSTRSLENPVTNLKKTVANATRRRESPNRTASGPKRSSQSTEPVFSYTSAIEDDAEDHSYPASPPQYHACNPPRMPVSNHGSRSGSRTNSRSNSFSSDHEKPHHHRISFPSIPHFGRSKEKDSHHHHHHSSHSTHTQSNNSHASLRWELESPPIVFYGDAENSSGALVSGQLFLDVKEEGIEFESFNATLNIHVTQKKPFTPHCHDCANQFTELNKWTFLPQPLVLAKGLHTFPFSVLLGGHLPASMDGQLISIAYEFKAEAIPAKPANGGPALPSVKLEKMLDVKRSLPEPELPHHSVRVFPPTNIKASVHYPQVIHPIGSNTLQLKLDGIAKLNPMVNTIEYWKLKKLTWRLEETAKTVSPACEKHQPKDNNKDVVPAEPEQNNKKGLPRTETRTIGEKTIFSGWKSNYGASAEGASESSVEVELEYLLGKHAKFSCDTKSRDGSEVTHQLMVEMVVSQEWAPVGKPALVTQTGVGRILRMQFSTVLTERGGIGISWDNEAPPIYQDVPPSPPSYNKEMFCDIDDAISEAPSLGTPLGGSVRNSVDVARPPYSQPPSRPLSEIR